MKKVDIKDSHRVFDDFFKIEEANLQFERFDGKMSDTVRRLNFERGDSVAALVLDRHRKEFIFTSQFRYPTYKKGPGWILEIVAGMVEKGESPENTIRREILEEIGYEVEQIEYISTFYLSPGGSSERILLYYAEVSDEQFQEGEGGGLEDEHEDIQVKRIPIEEVQQLLQSDQLQDAKSLIALQWWALSQQIK
ncbi:MAG: NUDIX hydrolase [Bacteroidota bacterium]